MAESTGSIEDAIKKEIEFTAILANSIVARNAVHEHECNYLGEDIPCDFGCDEADELSRADGNAFDLAIDAIKKRFVKVNGVLVR